MAVALDNGAPVVDDQKAGGPLVLQAVLQGERSPLEAACEARLDRCASRAWAANKATS
jgi:hypothetical protein